MRQSRAMRLREGKQRAEAARVRRRTRSLRATPAGVAQAVRSQRIFGCSKSPTRAVWERRTDVDARVGLFGRVGFESNSPACHPASLAL
jgi:hypothetical protein